jgi:hypothetical protein
MKRLVEKGRFTVCQLSSTVADRTLAPGHEVHDGSGMFANLQPSRQVVAQSTS